MNRPTMTTVNAIRAIKMHASLNLDYLEHIFSDRSGNHLVFDGQDQFEQAKNIFETIDSSRPITVITSDQTITNHFPLITVNEEISNDRGRIGSGQGMEAFISSSGLENKIVNNLSSTTVSINVFSDRRAEADILSHTIYCGLLGMAAHFNFEKMMNLKVSKLPFRRLYEGHEDMGGVCAYSITISADLESEVPVIDTLYANINSIGINGIAEI